MLYAEFWCVVKTAPARSTAADATLFTPPAVNRLLNKTYLPLSVRSLISIKPPAAGAAAASSAAAAAASPAGHGDDDADDASPGGSFGSRRSLPRFSAVGHEPLEPSVARGLSRAAIEDGTARLPPFEPAELPPAAGLPPLMLSFGPSGKLTGQLVAVQVDEGRWAELSLSRSKAASFALRHEDVVYELAAQVTRAPADFHRTRLVTLLPRYVLLNSTPFDLVVGQAGHDAWFLMPRHRPHSPAQRLVWHWPSARHKRRLCVKVLDADGSEWLPCAPFKLGGGGGASSGLRCLIKSRHPSEPRKLRVLGVHLEVARRRLLWARERRAFTQYSLLQL